MEEIELHIIKNEIIKIGDKLIDSDDIFQLCKRVLKSRSNQCIDKILECIFYMPVKIGIYATMLGIISKGNEKLKLQIILKLNHNIEVFIKDNPLHCLLWFRCIIGLSCCHVFDFIYCLNLFKNMYELCIELYKEKKFVKGDNILYIFLSNFFYISKQIYDKNKEELDTILMNCFDLIEKRQQYIDNIDIDNNDISTVEYIYIYINSIIHSNNYNDRLYYLKNALYNYVQNNLKSVATHRFYQKEIFQNIFMKEEQSKGDSANLAKPFLEGEGTVIGIDLMDITNDMSKEVRDPGKGGSIVGGIKSSTHSSKKREISMQEAIEKCVNVHHFMNYECVESINSLQIKFITKHGNSKNIHDIWLMQEHVLHIIELYNNSVEFSSKILGIYVQLQSKLYNNILIECIINKLLSSFNKKNFYFYISLVHRLLLINKNLGSVIIRCIKFVLKQIGKLDNESFYLFMELCIYMLSYFSYENKLLKNKENFFKRKYNDMNIIVKAQEEKIKKFGGDTREKNMAELGENKRKRKRDELEGNNGTNDVGMVTEPETIKCGETKTDNVVGVKKNQVILRKNESTLNEMKTYDCRVPFCVELDIQYSSDESSQEEGREEKHDTVQEENSENAGKTENAENAENTNNAEKEKHDGDESDDGDCDDHDNSDGDDYGDGDDGEDGEHGEHNFDFAAFKEELEQMDMSENLKKFTNLMYNVKKKHCRKWVRNFYFKSYSLVYKKESENMIPKSVVNYCNNFRLSNDNSHENFREYLIFNAIVRYSIDEVDKIEDEHNDLHSRKGTDRDRTFNKEGDKSVGKNAEQNAGQNAGQNAEQSAEQNAEENVAKSVHKLNDAINALIQSLLNYLCEKWHLSRVPNFFENLSKNIHQLNDISSTNLDGSIFENFIFKNDFLPNSECWNSYSILVLFFKTLLFFDSSNVSSLKKVFKYHAVIFRNYKNSGILKSEDDNVTSILCTISVFVTLGSVLTFVCACLHVLTFASVDTAPNPVYAHFPPFADEYYVLRLLYESIDNLITKKECTDLEKSKLKRQQTKNENEELIKKLEDKKNELIQKIFHLTNKIVYMLGNKMMQLKNENKSYMSKELLKESLVFLRTYLEYIDIDQFLQLCQENNFASELLELATIFKYASLKKKNDEN
ncbi:hypothetical protein, conserved [Plasmodium ovale wallikeri]|uniref:Uncharacterized protein n=1 Tax=Plasmodium ovale wallikeri TaxID=864142 RepID=A0A1A8Z0A3_PLAOA|nr:hypothetical protein, conserved [Plasmodium ovale wallikeri]SBT37277.1 hypothetical protein, conserved [Plasmodium ovale wallikeri]